MSKISTRPAGLRRLFSARQLVGQVRRHRLLRSRTSREAGQQETRTRRFNWSDRFTSDWLGNLSIYRLKGTVRAASAADWVVVLVAEVVAHLFLECGLHDRLCRPVSTRHADGTGDVEAGRPVGDRVRRPVRRTGPARPGRRAPQTQRHPVVEPAQRRLPRRGPGGGGGPVRALRLDGASGAARTRVLRSTRSTWSRSRTRS